METRINNLIANWQKRNIRAVFCKDSHEAQERIIELVPPEASVGLSGSMTLTQLKIIELLERRGNVVFNQFRQGLSNQEKNELRNKGALADYYLTSANAVSEDGELVFLSAYGQRVSGIANAPFVIVVCGINKLVPDLKEALSRARNYATPLNCKRLEWKTPCFEDGRCRSKTCLFPEYKRMCCQTLIIEAEVTPGRLHVILVGEELGF